MKTTDYKNDVYRITDCASSKCWYGFIYVNNQSGYNLKEKITPKLYGFEVIGRDDCNINIDAGCDDIIVLRRVNGDYSLGLSWLTYPRELSNAEIITETKTEPKNQLVDDCHYQMKCLPHGTTCIFL